MDLSKVERDTAFSRMCAHLTGWESHDLMDVLAAPRVRLAGGIGSEIPTGQIGEIDRVTLVGRDEDWSNWRRLLVRVRYPFPAPDGYTAEATYIHAERRDVPCHDLAPYLPMACAVKPLSNWTVTRDERGRLLFWHTPVRRPSAETSAMLDAWRRGVRPAEEG